MGQGTTPNVAMPRPGLTLTAGLLAALIVLAFGAVLIGPYGLSPGQVVLALLGQGDPQAQIVVWHIRLPRVGAALLMGAALAAAGTKNASIVSGR